ncbi:MAG: hypothetical protein IKV61_01885 [Clostridia bacterium]|nr:hypothetical protein [Clostridia bacterium]
MKTKKDINILDIIIAFVKGIKESGDACFLYDDKNRLWKANYLLGQILRLYEIEESSHKFLSIKAKNVWELLTDEDIKNYYYNKKVIVKKDVNLTLGTYKGASTKPTEKEFVKGSTFKYREIFHDEHVIPIGNIIDKLTGLKEDELTYENVQKILDNIYVCRILKSENAELNKVAKTKRPWEVIETIEEIYIKGAKIEIDNWQEKKENLKK